MAGQIWVAFQVAVRYARIIGSGFRCCKPDKEPRCERTLPCDKQKGKSKCYRDAPVEITLMFQDPGGHRSQQGTVRQVIETAKRVLHTGNIGIGRIFITDVENIVRVRTGEDGCVALQTDRFCIIIF